MSPQNIIGPSLGDCGFDVFETPKDAKWTDGCIGLVKEMCRISNPKIWQEAVKALGEVDVKGWGKEM